MKIDFGPSVRILCLLISAAALWSGCRFLSSDDEEDEPAFEVTIAETELTGTSRVTLEGSELEVWGEFLQPDSSVRFLTFVVPDFSGEQLYSLERASGTYGAVSESDTLRYAYSSGRPEDRIRVSSYDSEDGTIRGELFFYAVAFTGFDGIQRDEVFGVSGRFRADLE